MDRADDVIEIPTEFLRFFIGTKGIHLQAIRDKVHSAGNVNFDLNVKQGRQADTTSKVQLFGDGLEFAADLVRTKIEEIKTRVSLRGNEHMLRETSLLDTQKLRLYRRLGQLIKNRDCYIAFHGTFFWMYLVCVLMVYVPFAFLFTF